jgi:hypothetical protein
MRTASPGTEPEQRCRIEPRPGVVPQGQLTLAGKHAVKEQSRDSQLTSEILRLSAAASGNQPSITPS